MATMNKKNGKIRELLSPADDTASIALLNVQTAITRVKETVTEGISKGWTDALLTKKLNSIIAQECDNITDNLFREQFRKSLVTAARKWHYQISQTYKVLDINLAAAAANQPLNEELTNLIGKTPYQKNVEFRRLLDEGTNPGIPVIKDYQQSVKLLMRQIASDTANIVEVAERADDGEKKVSKISARLKAELAVRYDAAVKDLQALQNDGVLFCWISSHANCSPRCSHYQGQLYSLFETPVNIDGKTFGVKGTIDQIPYRPLKEALAGPKGDGNGCISGYNCRHRAIEYKRGSKPPQDFTKEEMDREYAIDKKQRYYERVIRNLKIQEKQFRASGDLEEAKKLRKKWRLLTNDYKAYSISNNRAYYPYRIIVDKSELN